MPSAEFELATPTIQWPQTYALDHMATKIDRYLLLDYYYYYYTFV